MRNVGWLGVWAVVSSLSACSSSSEPAGGDASSDDGGRGDAGTDAAVADTGVEAGRVDAGETDAGPVCSDGDPCADNPGGPCRVGRVSCEGGEASCVDDVPAPDGTGCVDGLCAAGQCLGSIAVSSDVDLTTTPVTAGRTCAEAPSYSVVSLAAREATLAEAPEASCLAAGDEVLLIVLQGTPSSVENVGVWELLTVDAVAGTTVRFTYDKARSYGAGADSDSGVGTDPGDVKVALVRVPRFGALTIAEGATLTAAPFDGALGGVIALRAASLTVDGTIDARALGYRGGRWSRDGADCDDNVTTESGESIAGPGTATTLANAGGAGGIAAASNDSFNSNSPISPSPGHARAGEDGINADGRTLGEPGAPYGAPDGSLLTMGSGPGGNLTCSTEVTEPVLVDMGGRGGGVVLLWVGSLAVSSTGAISATPPDASRDVAFAGGFVRVQAAGDVALGDARVTAQGSVGRGVNGPTVGMSNRASEGYIVVETAGTVTGTTDPAARLTTL